ncbi:hypothetical protein NDU88_000916 [Pleurodeles waltl]|uniref:Uncharacterized protein n=1 Tax=Pleurodeles waltl TaxID=8319 RepID=A0AAV7V8W0_PLEWA|nr:hypothetical protein NDU88_000916 [Pleurodeles waltl]
MLLERGTVPLHWAVYLAYYAEVKSISKCLPGGQVMAPLMRLALSEDRWACSCQQLLAVPPSLPMRKDRPGVRYQKEKLKLVEKPLVQRDVPPQWNVCCAYHEEDVASDINVKKFTGKNTLCDKETMTC